MNRRGFLTGVAGLLAAPAIVRVSSLMPVSVVPMEARAILPLPYLDSAWIRKHVLPSLYENAAERNAWLDQRAEAMKLFGVRAEV